MKRETVGIIGGGLAGAARAILESEAGAMVTLVERNACLGGRVSSFDDSLTQSRLDYCAHVWMNSCTAFQQFAQKVQIIPCWKENRQLFFAQSNPDREQANAPSEYSDFCVFTETALLPGLLRFFPSLVGWKSLTWTEKSILARQLLKMKRLNSFQGTIGAWLKEQSTPENLIRHFWEPVVVSALSCQLDEGSLYYAQKVCRESFLIRRGGNRFWTATEPLGVIMGATLKKRLEQRGIDLMTKTSVARLLTDGGDCVGFELAGGQKRFFDRTVLATDLTAARKLVPGLADQTSAYIPRAISTAHVWTDRPIIESPHAIFPGRLIQWIIESVPSELKKTAETALTDSQKEKDALENRRRYSQVIVSGSDGWLDRCSRVQFEARIRQEIEEICPTVKIGRILPVHVQKATFVPSEDFERQRKNLTCPFSHLTIIGDWTDTDWPATMESAVRSANRGFITDST